MGIKAKNLEGGFNEYVKFSRKWAFEKMQKHPRNAKYYAMICYGTVDVSIRVYDDDGRMWAIVHKGKD